jgi:hypothetical protein
MGRRAKHTGSGRDLQTQAAAQLRTLMNGIDLAEFKAQVYASDLVDMLAGMAFDPTIAPADLPVAEFRAKIALQLLNRAYGTPTEKTRIEVHEVGSTVSEEGLAVRAQITIVEQSVAEYKEMEKYFHLPPDQWPDWLRARMERASSPDVVPAIADGQTSS